LTHSGIRDLIIDECVGNRTTFTKAWFHFHVRQQMGIFTSVFHGPLLIRDSMIGPLPTNTISNIGKEKGIAPSKAWERRKVM
jgi:hypothetical protein